MKTDVDSLSEGLFGPQQHHQKRMQVKGIGIYPAVTGKAAAWQLDCASECLLSSQRPGSWWERHLKRTRLGALLREAGVIKRWQLTRALRFQRISGQRIGEVLITQGWSTSQAVRIALAAQRRLRLLPVLAVLCMVVALSTGCNQYDYKGAPTISTPWDTQWDRVQKAIQEAAQIRYKRDEAGEYWQTPDETARLGTGDCEDISIWLYARLMNDGVDGVRVSVGRRESTARTLHAWVTWLTADGAYILDPTISPSPMNARLLAANRYEPYYSYDSERKYVHGDAGGWAAVAAAAGR